MDQGWRLARQADRLRTKISGMYTYKLEFGGVIAALLKGPRLSLNERQSGSAFR
jgi:hypothetical protein